MSSRLDAWTIVEHTSGAEASDAGALDLRELALQDIDEIGMCAQLRVALLSCNLLNELGTGLFSCAKLRKLDLAKNGLVNLPSQDEWSRLGTLQVLYLHDNQLTSLKDVGEQLVGLPALIRLTLFDNPLAKHPSYRHYCVNTFLSLRALDLHVISDEELIEGATFSPSLSTKCPASSLPLFQPPPPALLDERLKDEDLLAEVRNEISELNATHARLSPVLKLQAVARRIEPRRILLRMKEAERDRQETLVEEKVTKSATATLEAPAEEPLPPRPEIDAPATAARLQPSKLDAAATVVQKQHRGNASRRQLLTGELAAAQTRHEAANPTAPFLYLQTRHVQELEALLPAHLPPHVVESLFFEPTDCYQIRHPIEPPSDLAEPPLAGMLVRQRSLQPELTCLRLFPSENEKRMLKKLSYRYARPTKAEVQGIHRSLEVAKDTDSLSIYSRRQLVRLVLPDISHIADVLAAAKARNDHLLRAMGIGEGDAEQAAPTAIAEMLIPLSPSHLDMLLATLTLQRVWRSISTRMSMQPSLTQRLLRLRAAIRMQRWWRWHLVKERFSMLHLVRSRVLAVDSNKLYIPTALLEDLDGRFPLHGHELWPEHSSLKFTFSHTQEQNLQYFVLPDALRPEMPIWAAPRMPIAQSRSLAQPQEARPLLTVAVRTVAVAASQLPSFVRREWTCLGFLSALEASRRVAVLTAITYEPLARRTIHGRLQGTFFPPLFLYTWEELRRWEAASCIQAAELARRARYAFVVKLAEARERRAQAALLRAAEAHTNSLFRQEGEIEMYMTAPPQQPPLVDRSSGGSTAAQLNLTRDQLERMCDGQAQVLGVYGLPPVVSAQGELSQVLAEQMQREAAHQRESSAAAKLLMRERRAAELASMREANLVSHLSAADDVMRDEAEHSWPQDGVVSPRQVASSAGDVATRHAAPSARALMQMMQSVVAARSDMVDDVAAQQLRFEAAKRNHTAALRAELKQAHAELLADRELERQELLMQSRLERRQLQHALDERNRAIAAEVQQKHDSRRAVKDVLMGRAQSRSFTGGFVRQQNAMVRQLQLGDLRRRQAEVLAQNSAHASQARKEREAWRTRAAVESRRRAEALRQSNIHDRQEMARRTQSSDAMRERELDMVRLKQAQLREIRNMLSQPVDLAAAGPAGEVAEM